MKSAHILTMLAISLLLPAGVLNAGDDNSVTPAENGQGITAAEVQTVNSVTVAIINFESNAPGNAELGQQLSDILTARLSIYDQFQLVERRKLGDLIREHQLNLTGLVDTSQAVKVGKIAGAKIMVFGRAFTVDRDLYIVAKIVGTETSRVKGVIAKGKLESSLSDIIDQLVDKLVDGLEKWAPELLPKTEKFQNKLEVLKQQLEGRKLPTIAVMVQEVHINRPLADPAAETEIKKVLKKVGFEVIEVKRETLAKWAKDFSMAGVDIIVTGEGLSEFGTRVGGLVSCVARLEIQATERESHRIITSERTTRRAVDLSEVVAAKTALQAAGRELAMKLVEKVAQDMKNKSSK